MIIRGRLTSSGYTYPFYPLVECSGSLAISNFGPYLVNPGGVMAMAEGVVRPVWLHALSFAAMTTTTDRFGLVTC
jgi:hypothetical protein